MSLFNKLCLSVGKFVVYLVTFLSFFYMTDLVCTSVKPYITEFLAMTVNYYQVTIISAFTLVLFVGTIIYIATKIKNYRLNKLKKKKAVALEEDELIEESAEVVEIAE